MPDGGELLRRGQLRFFPVLPGAMESAARVRRAILEERPQVVAVELPGWLEGPYRAAIDRLPQFTVLVYPDASQGAGVGAGEGDEKGVYVVVEPADPFVEAARTALETGAELIFLEPDSIDRPHLPAQFPDPYALTEVDEETLVNQWRLWPQRGGPELEEHAGAMAWRLQGADPLAGTFVVVSLNLLDPLLEAMERPQDPGAPRRSQFCELVNPHPDCLAEITAEYPYLQERYEQWREEARQPMTDRRRVQYQLLKEAEVNYTAQTGDQIGLWQRRMIARYTRNLAMMESQLTAGLFDITVAARSVVDDNYAWEVWSAANSYSWQREQCELETLNLSGEEVFLKTRRMKLRRRLPRPKRMLMPRGLKRRPEEKTRGEWAEALDGDSICSYPPEDLVIEDYGKFLKQRARSMLSEDRVRVEPFTTSMLDGIDIRETIRNWHEGKIFVRRMDKKAGDVGAVIVIFDEDRQGRYDYLTTWLGEHQNESDMAFYSTHPFDHLVGPGIGRAEYGGFLMVLPPRRMYDVWSDPDYDFAETKPERLLMAALDYSRERHVVYVAAKPPRSVFRSIAAHLGRSIYYVPIGQLSPSKLKRIRVLHVLNSRDKRAIAKDYLW